MKRFNYILITLILLFGFQYNAFSQLSKLEREYQIYHKGKQYEIEILLEDKNEDNNYDFITVEINGNEIVESKLTFLNAESSSKPFPRDTRISDIDEKKCETSDEKMISFGVYDFNSIQVAQFHYDCE